MARDPGIVTVRSFVEDDLDRLVDFCERARARDPGIEPFSQRLQVIATGPRALLGLWRVAEGEDGALHGLAFAAVREQRAAPKAQDAGALPARPPAQVPGPAGSDSRDTPPPARSALT